MGISRNKICSTAVCCELTLGMIFYMIICYRMIFCRIPPSSSDDNLVGPSLLGHDLLWRQLCCLYILHGDLHGGIQIAFIVYYGSICASSRVFGKAPGAQLDCQANSGCIRGRPKRKKGKTTPCMLGSDSLSEWFVTGGSSECQKPKHHHS